MEYKDQSAFNLSLHVSDSLLIPKSEGLTSAAVMLPSGHIAKAVIIGASHSFQIAKDYSVLMSEVLACCPVHGFGRKEVSKLENKSVERRFEFDAFSYSNIISIHKAEVRNLVFETFNKREETESSSVFSFPSEDGSMCSRTAVKVFQDNAVKNCIRLTTIHEYLQEEKVVVSDTKVVLK